MNSEYLEKKFPKEYQNFFHNKNIVVSSPFIINWAGDSINNFSGISIKQKIPLRMYMALEKTNQKGVQFKHIEYRDPYEEKFISSPILQYLPYCINIQKHCDKKFGDRLKEQGLSITILSELGRGCGLGFNSLFSLCLSTLFESFFDKISPEKIDKLTYLPINEIINNKKLPISELFYNALDFDLIINNSLSVSSKITSMFGGAYPIVSFKEEGFEKATTQTLQSKNFYGYSLHELRPNLGASPYYPFDFAVVYSGKPVIVEHLSKEIHGNSNRGGDAKNTFREIFLNVVSDQTTIKKAGFFKKFIEPTDDTIANTFSDMMSAIGIETIYRMGKLFTEPYNEEYFLHFITVLNKLRLGNIITRKNSLYFLRLINDFFAGFDNKSDLIAIVPNDSTIMGGTLTIVTPIESMRKNIENTIAHLTIENPGVTLLYAHRRDGICEQGLRIDQSEQYKKYNHHTTMHSEILETFRGREFSQNHEYETKHDFILDTIQGKLIIPGEKITSTDLCSQQTTVEILKYLLIQPNLTLINDDLPQSTYSKNKNEMMKKIILPLRKLVKEKTGKDFPLECFGDSKKFTITLGNHNVTIGILKRVIRK